MRRDTVVCKRAYMDKFSLNKKVAYITGALGLIGHEISKAFAESGAKTIMLDIDERKGKDTERNMRKRGCEAYYRHFDISDLEGATENIKAFCKEFKGMDVWVNCAYPRTEDWGKRLEDISLASWRKNVDMHMNSYSWLSREAALIMKKQKRGSIINVGSTYGVVGGDFTIYEGTKKTLPVAYSAIKGGIINLTRYLASYFGRYNVRINTICPGGIFHGQDPVFVRNYERRTPLKRMGRPEEIASSALFLASDAASYVTGATIMVDGGWTAI